jgi:predicted dienelactone hydrolase
MRTRFLKILAGLVAVVAGLLVLATFLDTTERAPTFDAPGYTVIDMAVPARSVPVRLHVWYPAGATTAAPTLLGQNGLFYGSHIHRDAPALAGALPVVVVSHGSGGNAERLGWLAGYLASQGMIVAAPDHPGTTSGDSDPFQTPLVWQRTDDLTAVLNLLQDQPPAGLHPDLTRVAALGFSLGGYTALGVAGVRVTRDAFISHCTANPAAEDCAWMVAAGVDFATVDAARYDADHSDPRVTAAIAIDPALIRAVDHASLATAGASFLLINLGEDTAASETMGAGGLARVLPDALYLAIPGARHFSFLAECSTLGKIIIGVAGEDNICSDAGLRDRGVIHDELRAAIGAFLTQHFAHPF